MRVQQLIEHIQQNTVVFRQELAVPVGESHGNKLLMQCKHAGVSLCANLGALDNRGGFKYPHGPQQLLHSPCGLTMCSVPNAVCPMEQFSL
jgi:hypothetical protein